MALPEEPILPASITLALVVKYDPTLKRIDDVVVDLNRSQVAWDGEPVQVPPGGYDETQPNANRKVAYALLSYQLGPQHDYCNFLRDIWDRQKETKKGFNPNIRLLFGVKSSGVGRFVDLIETVSVLGLRINPNVLISKRITVLIRAVNDSHYQPACRQALSVICSGIDTKSGVFVSQPFAGPLAGVPSTSIPEVPRANSVPDDSHTSQRTEASEPEQAEKLPSEVTYEQTALMLDELLASAEGKRVLGFLQQHCPQAITKPDQAWVVAPDFRRGQGNVVAVLKQMHSQLRTFQGASASDWANLLNVVGGLLTFAIDPAWVEMQRASAGDVYYPSQRRAITFRDKKTADLMHLLTAAIANGFPRLQRVFEKDHPENHELGGLDLEKEVRGSLKNDELKLSISRAILHPNSIPESPNEAQLEALIKETRRLIRDAMVLDRDPYFTWHEDYLHVADILRSPTFDLRELLLIFSSNELLPGNLVSPHSEPGLLFRYAHDIYRAIQPHLSPE